MKNIEKSMYILDECGHYTKPDLTWGGWKLKTQDDTLIDMKEIPPEDDARTKR